MTVWLNPVAKLGETIRKEWRPAHMDWQRLAFVILVIGGCLLLAIFLVKQKSAHRRAPARRLGGEPTAAEWYEHMLRLTAARGFRKHPGHTPLEFARYVEQQWLEASPYVSQLTQLYYRGRFGQTPVSQEDMRAAECLLRELSALKKAEDP
jgi:Domain of unknown function (DUF4129)